MARDRPTRSIAARIALGFAAVLLAFGGVSAASLAEHRRSAAMLRLLNDGYLPISSELSEARATQAAFASMIEQALEESEAAAAEDWLGMARRVRPMALRRALEGAKRTRVLAIAERDSVTLRELERDLEAVLLEYDLAEDDYAELSARLAVRDRASAVVALDALRVRETRIQRLLARAWSAVRERISATSTAARDGERRAVKLVTALGLIALAIGLLVTWWSQRLLSPLSRLGDRVMAVARGEFSGRLEPEARDEIGRVTTEFENMVDALSARDRGLREATDALRLLQRTQAQILATMSAAVVLVDEEGRIRQINPAAQTLLGLGTDDVSRPLEGTDAGRKLEGLLGLVSAVASGAPDGTIEAAPLEGTDLHFHVHARPFSTADAASPRRAVLVVAEDVSEALRNRQRRLHTERLAAIGRLAAHVTHEVRNPLSAIRLNVEMLEEDLAGTSAQALLQSVSREVERLTQITEQYLRLARLPSPRLEPTNLAAVVRDVLGFSRAELERSQVQATLLVDGELPLVAMDEAQIRQALANLLRNAREAMPSGGRIEVRIKPRGDGVELTIDDQGAGIPEAERERVFDLFVTTKEHGTGLGLPLTQQVVAAHGGHIRCSEATGGGTRFEIWLPACAPAQSSEARTEGASTRIDAE